MELLNTSDSRLRAIDSTRATDISAQADSFPNTVQNPQVQVDDEAPSESMVNVVSEFQPITNGDQVIVLICGFLAVFQTIGPNLSYGVFQEFYVSSPASPIPPPEATDRAFIAFVGTLGAGLTWGGSIYVNPLMSRSKITNHIALAGGLLMSLGFLLASFCTKTWQLLLTQGLLYGIGSSLLYFPLISVVPTFFGARRASATGIVLSAAGVGGLVYSLATRALLSALGARWTLRVMALENILVCVPVALAARPSRTPLGGNRGGSMVSLGIARKPAFALQTTAALLQAAGNFVPMTFTPEFSTVLGYSAGFGAVLLAVNNGVNAVSRILTGVLADRWGRQNVLVLSVFGSAASVLGLWMVAAAGDGDTEVARTAWVIFVVLYGALAGGYMSLFPVTISEVFGLQAYASVNSFLYFARGLGAAFGSPVGGQILGDSRNVATMVDASQALGDYRKLIWYDGLLLLGSALCVAGVRGADAVEKKGWRWKA